MFRPLRSSEKTHGKLLRAELGESVDHALKAAGYAAEGVKATVGPKLAPAAERVRTATAKRAAGRTEEKVPSRWPKLAGLLAVGALMGAATAFVLRRRRQQQWEEYDPMSASERSSEASDAAGFAAVKEEREPAPEPESTEQPAA